MMIKYEIMARANAPSPISTMGAGLFFLEGSILVVFILEIVIQFLHHYEGLTISYQSVVLFLYQEEYFT